MRATLGTILFAALILSPGRSAANQGTQTAANVEAGEEKSWYVAGQLQFRMLAVTDKTPSNDRSMIYQLQGGYSPLDWLTLFGRVGVIQRFVAPDGETGVRMQDTLVGATANHSLSLAGIGWDRDISFVHRLGFYLPTSFASHMQDLYVAPEWMTQVRLRTIDELYVGVTGLMQYRFHKYAERAGPGGTTLPRFVVAGLVLLEYSPLKSKTYGTLTIGGDFYGYEIVNYPARGQDSIEELDLPPGVEGINPEDLVGSQASDVYVHQQYGYDVYLSYVPPVVDFLSFTVSLEQGGNVLRDGVVNMFAFHRDETTLAFTLTGRY